MGRELQKKRTRTALLAAAATLIAQGARPSVAEVADAAEVSRRTAYRYFPTQEQMLVEATLEALRPEIESAISAEGLGGDAADVEERLDRAVCIVQRSAVAHQALLRAMIRVTVSQPRDQGAGAKPPAVRRGYRRIDWLELAVQPVRAQLGKRRFERLISGLALCIGTEAMIVLADLRGLAAEEAEKVSRWSARALLRASLAETEPAASSPGAGLGGRTPKSRRRD
jgi:AcrR family transcriptional regulator